MKQVFKVTIIQDDAESPDEIYEADLVDAVVDGLNRANFPVTEADAVEVAR